MPELPEVETVRRQIEPAICHKTIVKVIAPDGKMTGHDAEFKTKLIGDQFTHVDRIGKLLIFGMKKSADFLLGHLKMTGQFISADQNGKLAGGGHSLTASDLNLPHKHTHIVIEFADGSHLYFNDMRKFGYLKFASVADTKTIKAKYGIEPMTDNYTWESFQQIFHKRKTSLKALLLNQQVISGLGNIYVDEACFRAKVLPMRPANSLNKTEQKALFKSCHDVMAESIKQGGTTFYNFTNAQGQKGNFSDYLEVFKREGQPCIHCDTIIEKIKFAGRGTHFCPKCQQ